MKRKELLELIVDVLEQEKDSYNYSNSFMLQIYRNKPNGFVWENLFNKCAIAFLSWNLEELYSLVSSTKVYRKLQLENFTLFKKTNLWFTPR